MIRFVTGTDTGIGKTVASAVLAHQARVGGKRVRYVKPVQTGAGPGEPGDADFVAHAAGVDAVELLRFAEPLAPEVAAERAGIPIDFDALVAAMREHAENCDLLLVEGAGGLLAPITEKKAMADLASDLDAELVVATGPGLGTLNHTALTLEAAEARDITVAGLVVCGWPTRPDLAALTNLDRLKAMAPVLAVIRRIRGVSVDGNSPQTLKNALERGTATVTIEA
jgi:dethiobiotin synthetase